MSGMSLASNRCVVDAGVAGCAGLGVGHRCSPPVVALEPVAEALMVTLVVGEPVAGHWDDYTQAGEGSYGMFCSATLCVAGVHRCCGAVGLTLRVVLVDRSLHHRGLRFWNPGRPESQVRWRSGRAVAIRGRGLRGTECRWGSLGLCPSVVRLCGCRSNVRHSSSAAHSWRTVETVSESVSVNTGR